MAGMPPAHSMAITEYDRYANSGSYTKQSACVGFQISTGVPHVGQQLDQLGSAAEPRHGEANQGAAWRKTFRTRKGPQSQRSASLRFIPIFHLELLREPLRNPQRSSSCAADARAPPMGLLDGRGVEQLLLRGMHGEGLTRRSEATGRFGELVSVTGARRRGDQQRSPEAGGLQRWECCGASKALARGLRFVPSGAAVARLGGPPACLTVSA
ncbi:hypothetical protein PSPO01_11048 [Paraphaeosphaeria sporulosa]